MYTIQALGDMVADSVRTSAYARALQQVIKPGAVVLDIGAGTGIFALLACRYGARKVYAVEPNDAIVLAQANAQANGWAEQIQFFHDISTRITLPERVDVMVSDLRGILPLWNGHLPSIVDARKRFLLPGGMQIPQIDRIWVAPVEADTEYKKLVLSPPSDMYGVNLEAAQRYTCNTRYKVNLKSQQLLAEQQCWTALDYTALESSDVSGNLTWSVLRNGVCHGIVVWFEALLAPGISFSNAPGLPATIYSQILFPWPAPVDVQAGDLIEVNLKANLVGNEYIWRWDSSVRNREASSQAKAAFQQSNFLGIPRIPAHFRKRSVQSVPSLNVEGRIESFILSLMDGRNSQLAIAQQLCERFSEQFPQEKDAAAKVAELSARFGQ